MATTTLYGRGTKLDRADWTTISHGQGSPAETTKGNVYLDDTTEILWTRSWNGSWIANSSDSWWTRTGAVLSPLNTEDGLNVNAVGDDTISLIGTANSANASSVELRSYNSGAGNANVYVSGENYASFAAGSHSIQCIDTTQLLIASASSASNAIKIRNSNLTGGLEIDSGSGGINAGTDGEFNITSADNSEIKVDADNVLSKSLTLKCVNATGSGYIYVLGSNTANLASYNDNTQTMSSRITADIEYGVVVRTYRESQYAFNVIGQEDDSGITMSTGATAGMYFNAGTDGLQINSTGILSSQSNNIIFNADEGVLITNQDLSGRTMSITAFANAGPQVDVTSAGHGLSKGDNISISGTTNYDGDYVVGYIIDADRFLITATWVSNDATGTITLEDEFGDDGPAFIKIGDQSTGDPLHLSSAHSDIVIETIAGACSSDIYLNSCDAIELDATGRIRLDTNETSSFNMVADDIFDRNLSLNAANNGTGTGNLVFTAEDNLDITCDTLTINGSTGANFSGAVTNITVVDGIVTAVS